MCSFEIGDIDLSQDVIFFHGDHQKIFAVKNVIEISANAQDPCEWFSKLYNKRLIRFFNGTAHLNEPPTKLKLDNIVIDAPDHFA